MTKSNEVVFFIGTILLLFSMTTVAYQSSSIDRSFVHQKMDTIDKNDDVLHLLRLPHTQFVVTMESRLSRNNNSIYAVSLALAWSHLRETLGGHVLIKEQDDELLLLDQTVSAANTLNEDDYEKKMEKDGDYIQVNTQQNVYLTFLPAFKRLTLDTSFFGMEPLAAFGAKGAENVLHRDKLDILNYQHDDLFAIRLHPNEADHEILLYRTDEQFQHLSAMYGSLCNAIAEGDKAKSNPKSQWRYEFTEFDELLVPNIEFDLTHGYPNLIGKEIKAKNKTFTLDKVTQSIAFVLDEKGASMQTEAEIVVNMASISDDDSPKPKSLICDGPFFVVIKKRTAVYPYFIVYVVNDKLLRPANIL